MLDTDDAPFRLLQLPDELLRHMATFLPPPEVPCTLRLICKHLSHVLRAHITVRVSPWFAVPAHAVDWWRRTRAASADSLTIAERRAMVLQAAKLGDLAVLQDVIAVMGCLVTTDLLKDCARSGFLAGCEHLALQPMNEYSSWALDALEKAAASGNMQLVRWAVERVKQTTPEVMTGNKFSATFKRCGDIIGRAAERGHGHVCAELLQVSGEPQTNRLAAAAGAARGGHVAMMDGLLGGGPWAGSLQWLVAGAAKGCDLGTLQRLHGMLIKQQAQERQQQQRQQQEDEEQHICPNLLARALSSPTPDWAAKAQWLLQQGHPRDARCWDLRDVAALPDAVERVGWMQRESVEFQGGRAVFANILTDAAARTGDLPLLMALLDCGAKFGACEMGTAGARGHTAWLRQLYESGCSISLAALFDAAGAGQAETVEWLWGLPGMEQRFREQNVMRIKSFIDHAVASGTRELVAWAQQVAGVHTYLLSVGQAVALGCVSFVEWLLEQGVRMQDTLPYAEAAANGDIAMLTWLKEHNCPYDRSLYSQVTFGLDTQSSFHAKTVRLWFLDNGFPGDWLAEPFSDYDSDSD